MSDILTALSQSSRPDVAPTGPEHPGTPSHHHQGHDARIRAHRARVSKIIKEYRLFARLNGQSAPYADPDLPGSLHVCIKCARETVAVGRQFREGGWTSFQPIRAGEGHAALCATCRPPADHYDPLALVGATR